MTITVDVRSDVEAELARRAAVQGRPLKAYAATLLEEAAHAPESVKLGAPEKANNLAELFASVRGLLTDEEIDHLFSRNPSTGRPVDLS
jgi:hypothetical protein